MQLKMPSRSFVTKLYQSSPALNPAAFIVDKEKPEDYAAGSVINDHHRAVEGIQPGIQRLQSLTSDQCEQKCQTSAIATGHGQCVQIVQLGVDHLRTDAALAAAAEYVKYLTRSLVDI